MPQIDPQLTNAMFFTAFVTFTGVSKAFLAGYCLRNTSPLFKLIATQRRRYALVFSGQLMLIACAMLLLSLGTISDIIAGMQEWIKVGLIGWVVCLSILLLIASPLITAVTLASIYRKPALMAYKRFRRNEYRTTRSCRKGYKEYSRSVLVIDPIDPFGGSFRDFLPA